ncbi:MAG: serine/threonine protein kinase [Chitinispirillaceae bacterium]|nr:serine/threonine protein kinase [Chitinispirillaceae bacterium]
MFPVIKNYTIVREIGVGGMAIVYEAADDRLQRTVAIKVLHPHLCRDPSASDRFIREARAAAKIDHPHVVRIFDFGSVDDLHYIIMEFVPGTTMERVLEERGAVSPENAIAVMGEIAEALAQAHSLGIIHRDVKPANILLHRQGRAMLSDFGLAHRLPDPRLTTGDAVAGTPSFMSPEQISGKALSAATDIYSWGICLYTLVAGRLPYANETFPGVIDGIRRGEIRVDAAVLDRLPPWCHDILHRCLAADPRERIGDANELLEQLALTGKRRPVSIDVAAMGVESSVAGVGGSAPPPSATIILPQDNGYRIRRVVITAAVLAAAGVAGVLVLIGRPGQRSGRAGPPRKDRTVVREITRGDTAGADDAVADTFSHAKTTARGRSPGAAAGRPTDRTAPAGGSDGARATAARRSVWRAGMFQGFIVRCCSTSTACSCSISTVPTAPWSTVNG